MLGAYAILLSLSCFWSSKNPVCKYFRLCWLPRFSIRSRVGSSRVAPLGDSSNKTVLILHLRLLWLRVNCNCCCIFKRFDEVRLGMEKPSLLMPYWLWKNVLEKTHSAKWKVLCFDDGGPTSLQRHVYRHSFYCCVALCVVIATFPAPKHRRLKVLQTRSLVFGKIVESSGEHT